VRRSLFQRIKVDRVILVNAGSLVGSTAVTSGLGFVYWWLAARQDSPEAIGFASAAISAMMLLGTFGMMGLGTLLIGELPCQRSREASLVSAALILVGGVGGCLGIIYAVVAPFLSTDFRALGGSIEDIILFAVGVSLTAITLVFDQALIGLLRGELQLWRNTLFAVVKLVALLIADLWLSHVTGLTIYATWIVGNIFSLAALAVFALIKRTGSRRNYLPEWKLLRRLGPAALQHHALNIMLQAPSLILPVLVTVMLSSTVNAWFYIAWNLSGIANAISVALASTLYAVSSARPDMLASKLRMTVGLAFLACIVVNSLLIFAPGQTLELFGHSYSEQAALSLRILALESIPFIIKNHYIALSRIRNQITRTTLVTIATGLLELGESAVGAHIGGLNGLSLGWFSAMCIEALFMTPAVYSAARSVKPGMVEVDTLHLPQNEKKISSPVSQHAIYDALVLDASSRKSLATVRSLGKRGLRVAALATSDSLPVPAFSSRWCQKKMVCSAEEGTEEYLAYLESILDSMNFHVLIPSSDGTIALIRQYRERLERRVQIALANEVALRIAVNKQLTLEVAKRLGLGIPRGILVEHVNAVEIALREIGLPAVVKPTESWVASEQQKLRVVSRLVTTPAEAHRAVEELTRFGGTILFQQFLSGRQETVCLFCAKNEIYARFAYWARRADPPLGGTSVLVQSIAYPSDIGEQAERLVREIGLEGYSEVEFRRDSAGKPYLMEINARLTAVLEHPIKAGVDFPYLLYQWASGGQIDAVKSYRAGLWMRYLWGDIATTVASIQQRGRPGVNSPARAILAFCTAFFIPMKYDYLDWRDPLPVWTAIVGRACGGMKRLGNLFSRRNARRRELSDVTEQRAREAETPYV
jgi:predicted ATP-grasp superfamily ATP-dependent carboligase/O-antigen/teichoic acid export membrane protein